MQRSSFSLFSLDYYHLMEWLNQDPAYILFTNDYLLNYKMTIYYLLTTIYQKN